MDIPILSIAFFSFFVEKINIAYYIRWGQAPAIQFILQIYKFGGQGSGRPTILVLKRDDVILSPTQYKKLLA